MAKYSRKSGTTFDSDLDEAAQEIYYSSYRNDYDYDTEAEKAHLLKQHKRDAKRRSRKLWKANKKDQFLKFLIKTWANLDSDPIERRVPGTLTVTYIAIIVGIVASIISFATGYMMAYGDAMSHLTIARRIFDSQSPGFQQLGTVWLPFPHIVLIPLTIPMFFWETGISGAILGVLCLAASTAAIYRICARIGIRRIGRLVAVFVFLANITLLYAFTTAMTEPVLIATLLGCVAGLAGWATSERNLSAGELAVFAGIPATMATLTRYEGWALVVSGSIFVAIVSWLKYPKKSNAFKMTFVFVFFGFGIPATLGILWWLAYNWTIYQDPLEFLLGPYSASAFTERFEELGLLTTKGNFGLSLVAINAAVFSSSGLFPILIAAVGVVILLLKFGIEPKGLIVWLLGTSYVFLLVSLFLGQHIMVNDMTQPPGWYNNRYSLSVAPFIAILCGVVVGLWKKINWVHKAIAGFIVVGVVFQNVWWMQDIDNRSAVIAEATTNLSNPASRNAALWLKENYDGGMLLIDESAEGNAVLPLMGIPMSQMYNRASSEILFNSALEHPASHVRWIFMHLTAVEDTATAASVDNVTQAMLILPEFNLRYTLVFQEGDFGIFRLFGN